MKKKYIVLSISMVIFLISVPYIIMLQGYRPYILLEDNFTEGQIDSLQDFYGLELPDNIQILYCTETSPGGYIRLYLTGFEEHDEIVNILDYEVKLVHYKEEDSKRILKPIKNASKTDPISYSYELEIIEATQYVNCNGNRNIIDIYEIEGNLIAEIGKYYSVEMQDFFSRKESKKIYLFTVKEQLKGLLPLFLLYIKMQLPCLISHYPG